MRVVGIIYWCYLFNSLLAYPLNQYKGPGYQSSFLPGQADYPDLTYGLTDFEVKGTLQDLTLHDLKSLDQALIRSPLSAETLENRASRRAQSRQWGRNNFRAAYDDGGREENDCDEPKHSKSSCPTTKRFTKTTTCAPKTTNCPPKTTNCASKTTNCASRTTHNCGSRTTHSCGSKTTNNCLSKSTSCGSRTSQSDCEPKSTNDIFDQCPKVNMNQRKKHKKDDECDADDYHCLARKQMEKDMSIFEGLEMPVKAPAEYNPAMELAGIQKMGQQIIPSLNEQGEPLDEALQFDSSRIMESRELHKNPASWKSKPLANFDQGHHARFERGHQSHLQQGNDHRQHQTNLNLDRNANFKRYNEGHLRQPKNMANFQQGNFKQPENLVNYQQGNLKKSENLANFHQKRWANFDDGQFGNMALTNSDRMVLDNWAKLDPANFDNIQQANWDNMDLLHEPHFAQEHYDNFELGKQANYQPAQEQQLATFKQQNMNNFGQDNQARFVRNQPAKPELGNEEPFEQGNQAKVQQQESQFDLDNFIENSARNPPRYLNYMQNDLIQKKTERRLNEDRRLSESLNLDKLTGEKEAIPAGDSDWTFDGKRGKRENRQTNDSDAENSRETYLKKLMDSFPRDQGSQINANVALNDWPFDHERMKRC